jgi:2-polyprenyl-3-methyl-5-hydroxy-6-metoxy-1,4-benzoquinol methylase
MSAATGNGEPVAVYGRRVERHGLGGSHRRILDEVPPGSRVLDLGCASGYLSALLAERGCTVTGFERDPLAAAQAREDCERVIVGDLESESDRAEIPSGFDVVVIGDVLEHVTDPWDALRFVRGLLAPGGIVVLSLPNVAAWPVRLDLLRGRFEYADLGILDRTHLRFFTRASAHALVRDAGFVVERERFVHLERRPGPLRRALPLPMSVFDRALARVLPGLFAQQFVLRLRTVA